MLCCCTEEDGNGEVVKITLQDPFPVSRLLAPTEPSSISERSPKSEGPKALPSVEPEQEPDKDEPTPKLQLEKDVPEPPLAAPVERFDLVMSKDGPFGVTVDVRPTGLTIVKLGDGSFAKQNAQASRRAQAHDIIYRLNGKSGGPAMVHELGACSGTVTFSIVRPAVIEAEIEKGTKSFGAKVAHHTQSRALDIEEIHVGALRDYLASAPEHRKFGVRDVIISVNGVSRDCLKMMEVIKESSSLKLEVALVSKV